MRREYVFYVYILASRKNGTLYVGVANDLERRMSEHKSGGISGFTRRYGIDRLVYYEEFRYVHDAINYEKALKGKLRKKKIALIEEGNPGWNDLSAEWYDS